MTLLRRLLLGTIIVLSEQGVASAQGVPFAGGTLFPNWRGPGHGPTIRRTGPEDIPWEYYRIPNGPFTTTGIGYGYGPAFAFGPGYGFGPGFGGPFGYRNSGAFGSTWTNGLSLYGPPVPTYGPVPGVFGGSDAHRLYFDNPFPFNTFGFGLGWHGRLTPSPRPRPATVSVYPQAVPQSVTVIPTAYGNPDCINMIVKLPEPTADLWIENKTMTVTGTERSFESPPLETGKTYTYQLLAKWTHEGKDRTESRTVTAEPGRTIQVDFSVPQ